MAREITTYCADETVEAIDELAREHGVPRSEVVRQLVETGLAEVNSKRADVERADPGKVD